MLIVTSIYENFNFFPCHFNKTYISEQPKCSDETNHIDMVDLSPIVLLMFPALFVILSICLVGQPHGATDFMYE